MNPIYWLKHPGYFRKQLQRQVPDFNHFVYHLQRALHLRPSDALTVKVQYRDHTGLKLNLKNPRRFNEKLNWLKLNYRHGFMTEMVDKHKAKGYAARKIGSEYVIPTYGVYKSWDEIDFDTLPEQFVLKTNHDSGGVAICRCKATFDFDRARKKLETSLQTDFSEFFREWPYKNVERRIIAEALLEDNAYALPTPAPGYKPVADTLSYVSKAGQSLKNAVAKVKEFCHEFSLSAAEILTCSTSGKPIIRLRATTPPHYSVEQQIITGCFGGLGEWVEKAGYREIDNEDFILQIFKCEDYEELNDYKLFCFDGEVKFFKIDFDRTTLHKSNYYDSDFKLLDLSDASATNDLARHYDRPHEFEEMKRLAAKMSAGIPFLRVDFYCINGKIYFSENTFFPYAGCSDFIPDKWNETFGEMLTLPAK